ncbi:MAG TPA: hypothetical protein VIG32_10280 [Candidatus Baltobacteraceae bacterium]|jgi:uncharacterized membrane protein YphA (DoxX/SURF4 family)
MKTASTIARILLGLIFVAAGLSGFLIFHNPPQAPPGLAGAFQDVFFKSGWVLFVDAIQMITGLLLLANRFVPLALTALAAVIFNIYIFHLTMAPIGLPAPIVVTVLWLLVALPLRSHFAPLLVTKAASS